QYPDKRNAEVDDVGELAGKKDQVGFLDRPGFLARAAGDSFFLERQNHQAAAHQTSDGIVFVQGVLDAGDDAAGGVSSLVGKGDHAIISIFNQAPIMPRLATTRISGTLPSCSPPKSISSNPRFGFGRRSIRR